MKKNLSSLILQGKLVCQDIKIADIKFTSAWKILDGLDNIEKLTLNID